MTQNNSILQNNQKNIYFSSSLISCNFVYSQKKFFQILFFNLKKILQPDLASFWANSAWVFPAPATDDSRVRRLKQRQYVKIRHLFSQFFLPKVHQWLQQSNDVLCQKIWRTQNTEYWSKISVEYETQWRLIFLNSGGARCLYLENYHLNIKYQDTEMLILKSILNFRLLKGWWNNGSHIRLKCQNYWCRYISYGEMFIWPCLIVQLIGGCIADFTWVTRTTNSPLTHFRFHIFHVVSQLVFI